MSYHHLSTKVILMYLLLGISSRAYFTYRLKKDEEGNRFVWICQVLHKIGETSFAEVDSEYDVILVEMCTI